MANRRRSLPVLLMLALLLPSAAVICRADDRLDLTMSQAEEGLELKLHGEVDLEMPTPWRLGLSASLALPFSSETGAGLSCAWVYAAGAWRWHGSGSLDCTSTRTEAALDVNGEYENGAWLWEAGVHGRRVLEDADGEYGVNLAVEREFNHYNRFVFAQQLVRVIGDDGAEEAYRYGAAGSLALGGYGRGCELSLGGTARRGSDPADDYRRLYSDLAWHFGLGGTWKLDGEIRLEYKQENTGDVAGGRAMLALYRISPWTLKFQAEYKADAGGGETRCGILAGCDGAFSCQAGLAGAFSAAEGNWEVWPYAVLGYRGEHWRATLGLTPLGQYAANSRQAYWLAVGYAF